MNEQKTKIYVLPKVTFHGILERNDISDENVNEFTNYAFVCINDFSGDYYHNPLFIMSHHNVINLFFDDVKDDFELSPTNKGVTKAFTEDMAKKLVKFLDDNKHVKVLMVHCAAGISRSGAVGQFALDYLNGDKEFFKINNSHITPNAEVSRILNNYIRNRK